MFHLSWTAETLIKAFMYTVQFRVPVVARTVDWNWNEGLSLKWLFPTWLYLFYIWLPQRWPTENALLALRLRFQMRKYRTIMALVNCTNTLARRPVYLAMMHLNIEFAQCF